MPALLSFVHGFDDKRRRILFTSYAAAIVITCNLLFVTHADASARADGRAVYDAHCARCHGDALQGQPDWRIRKPDGRLPAPPHDETGHTWHHPDHVLFEIVKFGLVPPNAPPGYASDMPAFNGVLNDGEIRAVIEYIKSRWPEPVKTRQIEINQRASPR